MQTSKQTLLEALNWNSSLDNDSETDCKYKGINFRIHTRIVDTGYTAKKTFAIIHGDKKLTFAMDDHPCEAFSGGNPTNASSLYTEFLNAIQANNNGSAVLLTQSVAGSRGYRTCTKRRVWPRKGYRGPATAATQYDTSTQTVPACSHSKRVKLDCFAIWRETQRPDFNKRHKKGAYVHGTNKYEKSLYNIFLANKTLYLPYLSRLETISRKTMGQAMDDITKSKSFSSKGDNRSIAGHNLLKLMVEICVRAFPINQKQDAYIKFLRNRVISMWRLYAYHYWAKPAFSINQWYPRWPHDLLIPMTQSSRTDSGMISIARQLLDKLPRRVGTAIRAQIKNLPTTAGMVPVPLVTSALFAPPIPNTGTVASNKGNLPAALLNLKI